MADFGAAYLDAEEARIRKELEAVYREAANSINNKMESFNNRYAANDAKYRAMVKDGSMTESEYKNWLGGQVFQGQLWESKQRQITDVLRDSNKAALDIVNSHTFNVFAFNANYQSFSLEKELGANLGFGMYSAESVSRLIKDKPNVLPPKKLNEAKDKAWNMQKIRSSITQGIIQGESIDKVARRMARDVGSTNMKAMNTHARTAMTGAQNAGRLEVMERAEEMGIKTYKEWMATLDDVTRDSHAELDGEKVYSADEPFSNGLMYPADPSGEPAEVYNCRCTMVVLPVDYQEVFSRRDNETGEVLNKLGPDTVANLTYNDWAITREVMSKARTAEEVERISNTLLSASALGHGTVNYAVGSTRTSFDFKYKGFDSLFRKITTKSASKGMTKEQYAQKITDALRFTNLSPSDTLTDDYFTMVGSLESQGYKMVEVANTFVNYTSYRGINTLVESPNGYTFELQFHTPQSMEIKEINHKLYEEERKLDKVKDKEKIDAILKKENENAKAIVTPVGVDRIKNIE